MNDNAPILAIKCLAYNHEPYIRQCLDGFVMQKTNFPFIAIIHDDASTDRTAKIIQEYAQKYPAIIKPIFETENQYSKHNGSIRRTMDCAIPESVQYIAICEGDDYWIDSNKLQKQVDFLEKNPNYGLVHTYAKSYNNSQQIYDDLLLGNPHNLFEDLLYTNNIATLTTCYKKELYTLYVNDIKPESKNWLMGDFSLWLWMATKTKIGFISEITAVYRILAESASHSSDKKKQFSFYISSYKIALFYAKKNHYKRIKSFINKKFVELLKYIIVNRTIHCAELLYETFKEESNLLNIINSTIYHILKIYIILIHFKPTLK